MSRRKQRISIVANASARWTETVKLPRSVGSQILGRLSLAQAESFAVQLRYLKVIFFCLRVFNLSDALCLAPLTLWLSHFLRFSLPCWRGRFRSPAMGPSQASGDERVPFHLEIALVKPTKGGSFPGQALALLGLGQILVQNDYLPFVYALCVCVPQ